MVEQDNFIEAYLDFFEGTEPPTIFNRWSIIGGLGALLGRQAWIQHGHKKIYANQYIMLVGESGTRKSTAIKTFMLPLLEDVGYRSVAASKTSKEKFLADFEEGMDKVRDPEERLDVSKSSYTKGRGTDNRTMRELFGIRDAGEISECLIASDDLNVFLGHSNIEFIEMLTDLWDYDGTYSSRTKSGKSVLVPNPTLSMLTGNTQIGIAMAFPIEIIGQGFFSRLISVFSEPSGRRITFPPPANMEKRKKLLESLTRIRHHFRGEIKIEARAMIALDTIYKEWRDIDDQRFKSYSTRRFTHLLKLCMCCAAAYEKPAVDVRTVKYANSILHYTESFMPKALGEFGKARNSDISAKILDALEKSLKEEKPGLDVNELWAVVSRDLDGTNELARVLVGLKDAKKIQSGSHGKWLPYKTAQKFDFPHCDMTLIREYMDAKAKEGEPI